ncbi:restriction endonuclease [Citrobacter sp. RHBSTW-00570]|uniref:nSTAND3 domain-containing NTPase n=1 Tax=Citrobacter TaxID=544 RepID=UPI0015EA4F83|nr:MULTISPECIES: restriction endonuclease [Citrobacter]MCR3702036.1 restriction endonuclease [Citrobacter portucalensis]QLV67000.1 restriction endonuclease [Citrobacter sp. RHBSTW-00570]
MSFNFRNLSSADFEDLVLDLIGKEEGFRFEAFCAGPDGGADGRHSHTSGNVILQAKHYEGSQVSKLIATMRRERISINMLAPIRYILATSCKLSPASKSKLAPIIGPSLKSEADIFGPEDINGLLRKYPEILKSHIKLWLSGAGVLERIIRAAAHTFAAFTQEEIEKKVRVFASNPSFGESFVTLEKHGLLIISGPPGVGKTTLAEMLCYTYLNEQWELVPIRSLEDGFAAISDNKKQVFLFDDFLGKVALDRLALAHKDSDLMRFMNRVRRSPNARFILTTRGYIFEEARRVSEYLSDQRLDVTKYVLDVGIYTRRIKARILYNHLLVSKTPLLHIQALLDSNTLAEIVDHKNYNPRIIEAMTDTLHINNIEIANYPTAFIEALNNPSQIWDTAFRTHIDHRCRHLLIAMFFLTEYGVSLATLRSSFDTLHTALCKAYGLAHGPKDFEETLHILEGSFVKIVNISGPFVSFINPSLKDYLSIYLRDAELLIRLVSTAASIDWLLNLWSFVHQLELSEAAQTKIAIAFVGMLEMIETRPHWRPKAGDARSLEYNDAANSKRLRMLMDFWQLTNERRFADSIIAIARNPQQGFSAWSDGETLIEFFSRRGGKGYRRQFIYEAELLELLEKGLTDAIHWSSSDILSTLVDAVDAVNGLPASITRALQMAVLEEFEENTSRICEDDSESSLSDRIDALKKFAPRFGVSDAVLNSAISAIEERIGEIEDHSSRASSPSFLSSNKYEQETFNDRDLRDLFTTLLDR